MSMERSLVCPAEPPPSFRRELGVGASRPKESRQKEAEYGSSCGGLRNFGCDTGGWTTDHRVEMSCRRLSPQSRARRRRTPAPVTRKEQHARRRRARRPVWSRMERNSAATGEQDIELAVMLRDLS